MRCSSTFIGKAPTSNFKIELKTQSAKNLIIKPRPIKLANTNYLSINQLLNGPKCTNLLVPTKSILWILQRFHLKKISCG